MGALCCCLPRTDDDPRDPLLDREARARAAEAAQARLDQYNETPAAKRAQKAAAREKAAASSSMSNEAHQQRINDIIS